MQVQRSFAHRTGDRGQGQDAAFRLAGVAEGQAT